MRYPKKYLLAMILALLLWGLSFPALKIALRTNGALAVIFYRYGFSLLLALPWFFFRRRGVSVLLRNRGLLILGVCNWAGSILQFAGLRLTSAVKSVVLTQLLVVAVPILAVWILNERLDAVKIVAILVSVAGAVTLSTNLDFSGLGRGSSFTGDLLTVAAVFFWSFFIVYTRRFVQIVDGSWLLLANFLVTFCLSALAAAAGGKVHIDRDGTWLCLFLAVFCTILPTVLYNYAMKAVDATASAVIGPLETVSAVGLAYLLLGERLTWTGAAGALLIILSTYLVVQPAARRSREKLPG